jgi:NADH dehydrogenase (ubiquinone) Fe-S protein 4
MKRRLDGSGGSVRNAAPSCSALPSRSSLASTHQLQSIFLSQSRTFTTMSLLRAGAGIFIRPTPLGRTLALSSRSLATGAPPSAPVEAEQTQTSSEIAPLPQKDVVTADVISGAPSAFRPPFRVAPHLTSVLQRSSGTAPCASTSRRATRCRVAARRWSAGVLIGIFFPGVDAGRTRSWGGPARALLASCRVSRMPTGCRADYMQGTRVSFRSKEDAIHFAEKQGAYAEVLLRRAQSNTGVCHRLGLLCVSCFIPFDRACWPI